MKIELRKREHFWLIAATLCVITALLGFCSGWAAHSAWACVDDMANEDADSMRGIGLTTGNMHALNLPSREDIKAARAHGFYSIGYTADDGTWVVERRALLADDLEIWERIYNLGAEESE